MASNSSTIRESTILLERQSLQPAVESGRKDAGEAVGGEEQGEIHAAQIEDQMRIMEVSVNGQHQSGAPNTLVGQTPTDAGTKWIYAGSTADGKPILTQSMSQANAELQSYIIANTNSATAGQVPSLFNYDRPTGNERGFEVTGPFTKFDQSDVTYVRNTAADTASMVSTNAGRFGSVAAAVAEIPSPYSPGLSTALSCPLW